MSRSIHSLVSKKATNKTVFYNGQLSSFVTPHVHHGDLYISRDLFVERNTHLKDLEVSGDLTVLGDTSLRDTDVSGNLMVMGDTSLRDTDVSGNLNVNLNLLTYGTITARQYTPGQVIRTMMYNNTQLGQSNATINGSTTSGIFSFNYTPVSSSSYILIEYQTIYYFGGSNADSMTAYLYVDYGEISRTYQQWLNGPGGGSRSGAIFPIVGRYTNTTTTAKPISVSIVNATDDLVTVNGDNSTWLKITEIGR